MKTKWLVPALVALALVLTVGLMAGVLFRGQRQLPDPGGPGDDAVNVDVVVVGAGPAGMAAAISAAEAGASVIILEKTNLVGGNANIAGWGITASETPALERENRSYTREEHFRDTMAAGQNINDEQLVRTMVDNSGEMVGWLEALGVRFSVPQPQQHRTEGVTGRAIVEALSNRIGQLEIPVVTGVRAERLIQEQGKVVGVIGDNERRYRGRVILATGGHIANPTEIARHNAELAGIRADYTTPGPTGDGWELGRQVGASFRDLDQVQIRATVVVDRAFWVRPQDFQEGAILVNREGQRFVNELAPEADVARAILAQPGQVAYVIFDNAARERSGNLAQGSGLAENYAELEGLLGSALVNSANLTETIQSYNGGQVEPERPQEAIYPIETGPFYLLRVAPSLQYAMGGIRINSQAQVLKNGDQPIPGLFAAGEITGGVHGRGRLTGNTLTDALVFGRIAGRQAAENN